MAKNTKNMAFIGYGLSLLYGISFLTYGSLLKVAPYRYHAGFNMLLFILLFMSALSIVGFNEWGRRLLVLLNIVQGFYYLLLSARFYDFIHPAYIFLSVVVILYFNKPEILLQFNLEGRFIRKSILLVDDDEGLLKTMKGILLPNGFSVLTANTGEKGLQIAKLQKPDLIILDVILPGIKGREVCAKLKEDTETQKIPVVFVTAKDSPDDIAAEKSVGADAHLTKPVNSKILVAEVRKLLGLP